MATAEELIRLAESQLGVMENPSGSNRVKYNDAYYGRAVSGGAYPWCCVFQWWLFHTLGADRLFYGGGKTASCTELYRCCRKLGLTVEKEELRRGDLVFFNFDGSEGVMNHIGLCTGAGDGWVTTIDGNTGDSSQANGGAVMERRRSLRWVAGAARPGYDEPEEQMELRIYRRVEEMPPYFQQAARKAIGLGVMGADGEGRVTATWPGLQVLTWLDRLGLLDGEEV